MYIGVYVKANGDMERKFISVAIRIWKRDY